MAKFCSNCGSPVNEDQDVCLKCGKSLNTVSKKTYVEEDSTAIYGVLGFFVPLVGLILFLLWQDERPKAAKSAGKGALISVIIGCAVGLIYLIIFLIIILTVPSDFISSFSHLSMYLLH
ncbi:MAG: zinc ribbon domain-containing protein [Firmicutes bacterium]|nr:zinc ribbon domain-containing protein [Bacillota bacterium]